MKFETLGNPSNPAVLLIHGSLCSAVSSKRFGEYLANDYYVLMPTLDGHDGASVYTSAKEEAAKILHYLMAEGIDRLAMLHGTSMGAVVAVEMLHQNEVLEQIRGENARGLTIDRCILDGGVFFHLPGILNKVTSLVMSSMMRSLRKPDRPHAVDKVLYSLRCRGLFGKKPEDYRPWVEDMYDVCAGMPKASAAGIAYSCYHEGMPQLTTKSQAKCWFQFSTHEPAYRMKKTVMKQYPEADYRDTDAPSHCYHQVHDPRSYAEYLCGILSGVQQPDPKPQQPGPDPQPDPKPQPEAPQV